jgi:hypothetical protein
VAKETGEWWDKEASKAAESLTNPRQKALFSQKVMQYKGMAVGSFAGHEAVQRRESLEQSTQASIVSSINMAAANVGNPEMVLAAKTDVVQRTQMLAKINGWPPEYADAKREEYLTNFHKQVLQGIVDKDPKAAQDYFTLNKGEIGGQHHAEIEKVLKTGATARRAQEFADEVMVKGLDEVTALAEARKKFEGDDEKNVVAEIKTRFAEVGVARERAQRNAADEAWAIYGRTGKVNDIPPSLLARLDGKDLAAIRNDQQSHLDREESRRDRAANRADREANRAARGPATDWDRYYDLRREALSDPEAFKKRDLRREFPHLGKTEREGLIDLQGKKPEELKDVASLDAQLSNAKDLLKLGGAANQEKRGRFDQVVTEAVRTEEKRVGKKLGFEERQKIIDRMVIEGDVNGWIPGGSRRRFEVLGTPEEAKFAAKVPEGDRAKITEALKRAGRPVTDEAVRELYLRRQGIQ